jgi:hypothetical protein
MKDDNPVGPKTKMLSAETPTRTGLTREVQAKIGQQLRAMYNDVVDQGVPDRFTDLLNKLDQGTGGASDKESK